MIEIRQQELLYMQDGIWGGCQDWYLDSWQRKAGCGPTSGANIFWYLSRTQPGLEPLCPYEVHDRASLLKLMEEVWHFITPTKMGVNTTTIFAEGAVHFGQQRNLLLSPQVLNIPAVLMERPEYQQVSKYLAEALENNLPVAFLNLSNGKVDTLDNWHWVTIIGFDTESGRTRILNHGTKYDIDLKLWLDSTLMGGGFVTITKETHV